MLRIHFQKNAVFYLAKKNAFSPNNVLQIASVNFLDTVCSCMLLLKKIYKQFAIVFCPPIFQNRRLQLFFGVLIFLGGICRKNG